MEKSALLKQLEAGKIAAARHQFTPVLERRKRLLAVLQQLRSSQDAALKALDDDLGKSEFEALTCEYIPLLQILKYLIRHIKKLSRPRRCGISWLNWPGYGRLYPEPYGQVLVVATWNYPLLLALEPVLGAYAAGNKVVLKLSNRSKHTMQFVRWLIETAFLPGEIIVIDGELSLASTLKIGFDYVFFTGSSTVGREVLAACAPNLTPATLELGGKNPCIVDQKANIKIAARRLVWGKFANAGQTCAAPDYVLVRRELKSALTSEIRLALNRFYGKYPLETIPRLVDYHAYERLCNLAAHGRLITGGERDPETFRLAPMVLDRLEADDPLLQQEIFGPILPIVDYASDEELLEKLKIHPQPLALYCFGGSRALRQKLIQSTSSGAVVFNDVVTHFINLNMPFGGVGNSGMGAYHGRRTFETFVHLKPVMHRSNHPDCALRYPPASKWLTRLVKFFAR